VLGAVISSSFKISNAAVHSSVLICFSLFLKSLINDAAILAEFTQISNNI